MFISEKTLEYPLSLPDVRDRLQQTLLPSNPTDEQMSYIKYPRVQPTAKPGGDVVTEGQPEWREGVPYQTWIVREYTPEEVEAMKPPPTIKYFLQGDVWERSSEDEAEIIDGILSDAPARIRRLWQDSKHIDFGSDVYNFIYNAMSLTFETSRIEEILAASGEYQ